MIMRDLGFAGRCDVGMLLWGSMAQRRSLAVERFCICHPGLVIDKDQILLGLLKPRTLQPNPPSLRDVAVFGSTVEVLDSRRSVDPAVPRLYRSNDDIIKVSESIGEWTDKRRLAPRASETLVHVSRALDQSRKTA